MYSVLKHLHVACVVLSLAGFILRGGWMLTGSARLMARSTRIVPHLIDTLLLGSAIGLVSAYDAVPGWVWAKVVGLLIYIALGTIALKRGKTMRIRSVALVLALLTVAWIVSVALIKSPAGFFA